MIVRINSVEDNASFNMFDPGGRLLHTETEGIKFTLPLNVDYGLHR